MSKGSQSCCEKENTDKLVNGKYSTVIHNYTHNQKKTRPLLHVESSTMVTSKFSKLNLRRHITSAQEAWSGAGFSRHSATCENCLLNIFKNQGPKNMLLPIISTSLLFEEINLF